MRDWDQHLGELSEAGARLVVISADSPRMLRKKKRKNDWSVEFSAVDAEQWEKWGLTNSAKSSVPYPTTLVVAPDGTLIFRETHINYKKRADSQAVIQRIQAHRVAVAAGTLPSTDLTSTLTTEMSLPDVDWAKALRFTARRTETGAVLELVVAEGFHLYGSNETTARPLSVELDKGRTSGTRVPKGELKELGGAVGSAWVLEGTIELELVLKGLSAEETVSGALHYQACTDHQCGFPASLPFVASPQ